MRKIWQRANPEAPSDSDEDEDVIESMHDTSFNPSKRAHSRTKSIDSIGELMMEE